VRLIGAAVAGSICEEEETVASQEERERQICGEVSG